MPKHILLALSPFPEKRPKSSDQRAAWVKVINNYFAPLFKSKDLYFSVVSSPFHDAYWKANYQDSYSKIKKSICLDLEKYTNMLCAYEMRQALYMESKQSNLIKELSTEVIRQYGSLPPPNLILQFAHHAPYLLSAFKDSPLLNFHEGGLSRRPFPLSWRFESGKFQAGTDLNGSAGCSLNVNDTVTPNEIVDFIRLNSYATLDRINPFKEKLKLWRKKFRRLYLLPLQVSGNVSFDALCQYENQLHFLMDVLEKTPADVGLIVTEHHWVPVITREINDELSRRFPNYIYEADFSLIMNVSTYFVSYVDAVITVSSSLFWHAALAGKICCGLGAGEFSKIADTNSLQELNRLSNNRSLPPYRYDALIYSRLKNWIPDSLMSEAEFLEEWLKYLCSKDLPKPNISDDMIMQNFANASNNLQFSKRNPLNELRRVHLPLSYKSAYEKLDTALLKTLLAISPFTKTIMPYIGRLYRSLQCAFNFLKRKFSDLIT